MPVFGNLLSLAKLMSKYPNEGLVGVFLHNGETNPEKVGVITQFGTKTVLDIHDPVFLEKVAEFIPDKID